MRDTTPVAESKTTPPPTIACNNEEEEEDSFESTGFMTAALLCELDEFDEPAEECCSKKPRLE